MESSSSGARNSEQVQGGSVRWQRGARRQSVQQQVARKSAALQASGMRTCTRVPPAVEVASSLLQKEQ
jgi:hypothetical protein